MYLTCYSSFLKKHLCRVTPSVFCKTEKLKASRSTSEFNSHLLKKRKEKGLTHFGIHLERACMRPALAQLTTQRLFTSCEGTGRSAETRNCLPPASATSRRAPPMAAAPLRHAAAEPETRLHNEQLLSIQYFETNKKRVSAPKKGCLCRRRRKIKKTTNSV